MGLGAAQSAAAAGGMGAVSARIAEIQSRIGGLTGSRVGQAPVIDAPANGSAVPPTTFDENLASAVASASRAPTPATSAAPVTSAVPVRAAGPATHTAPATRTAPATPAARTTTAAAASAPAPGSAAAQLAAKLPPHGRAWAPAITDAALRVGIEPALLAALVQHESDFKPGAVSHAGALGLAQLMPATAAGLGVDPKDPTQNLAGGARFLRAQLERFGAVDLALAAYNAGPTRVAQAGGVPRIAETTAYVSRVTATWEKLR